MAPSMATTQPITPREDNVGGGGDHQTGLPIPSTAVVVVVVVRSCGGLGATQVTAVPLLMIVRGGLGMVVSAHSDEGHIALPDHCARSWGWEPRVGCSRSCSCGYWWWWCFPRRLLNGRRGQLGVGWGLGRQVESWGREREHKWLSKSRWVWKRGFGEEFGVEKVDYSPIALWIWVL